MRATQQLAVLAVLVLLSGQALGQATQGSADIKTPATAAEPWEYTLTVDGYIVANETSYVNPVFTADHNWLHLEAYNDEELRTGSLWPFAHPEHGSQLKRDEPRSGMAE